MAPKTSSMIRNANVPRRGMPRVREVRGLEGLKGIALKVLARSVYREVVLVERELRNLWLEPSTDVPIQVRRLRRRDIRAYLRQEGARQTSYAYAENRGLVFRGSIFHQTAALRFAEGFENRRRNVTMLFRRSHS